MHIECRKSVALPVLNSFFVTDPDTLFEHIIDRAHNNDYKYDRKTKIYEVNKVIMQKYFEMTDKDPDKVIIDKRASIPSKPELVADDFAYQEVAGRYMSEKDNCLLFFDTGTGKTRTTIHALNSLNPRRVLIILGKSALAPVWQGELAECLEEYSLKHIINASLKSTKEKVKDLLDASATGDDTIVLMNVEGVRIPAVREAINKYQPEVVIIDECQVIKGSKSLQTQGVFDLESKHRWALSATPVINNPLEWYSLLKWLRVHNSAKSRFDSYYGNWEHDFWGHYVCTGYKNEEELQELVDFVSIRFIKNIGLPALHENVIKMEMTEQEEKIYQELMQMKQTPFLKTKILSDGTPIDNQAALFAYQRYFVATIHSKVERIKRLSQEKPVIVISMLVRTLNTLHQQLEGSEVYSGEKSAKEREQIIENFMTGKTKILLLSLKAGGVGLTLTKSWTIEFIDAPNNQAEYEQARDRVHRISQTHEVDADRLIAEGTHDEFAWENMNSKFGWIALYYKGEE